MANSNNNFETIENNLPNNNLNDNNANVNDNNNLNNSIFNEEKIKYYEQQTINLLNPIIIPKSNLNCDKLVYLTNRHINKGERGITDIINKNSVTDGSRDYEDIFNSKRIKLNKNDFKESKIQTANLNILFYKLANLAGPKNVNYTSNNSNSLGNENNTLKNTKNRPMENFKKLCRYKYQGDTYISCNLGVYYNKENVPQRNKLIIQRKIEEFRNNKSKILNCIRNEKIIIGFIDIYSTSLLKSIGFVDHKNCLIIDNKHKMIIRFEPKSFDKLSIRGDVKEEVIKQQLNDVLGNVLNSYNYITIRGGQTTFNFMKSYGNDSVYCVVYSLYSGLLFLKNYKLLNKVIENYNTVEEIGYNNLENNSNNFEEINNSLQLQNQNNFKNTKIQQKKLIKKKYNSFLQKIKKTPIDFLYDDIKNSLDASLLDSISGKNCFEYNFIISKFIIGKNYIKHYEDYEFTINHYLNNKNFKKIFSKLFDNDKKHFIKSSNINNEILYNKFDLYLIGKNNTSGKLDITFELKKNIRDLILIKFIINLIDVCFDKTNTINMDEIPPELFCSIISNTITDFIIDKNIIDEKKLQKKVFSSIFDNDMQTNIGKSKYYDTVFVRLKELLLINISELNKPDIPTGNPSKLNKSQKLNLKKHYEKLIPTIDIIKSTTPTLEGIKSKKEKKKEKKSKKEKKKKEKKSKKEKKKKEKKSKKGKKKRRSIKDSK